MPLTAVTRELRRFAAGDFMPSTLQTRDESELGDLVDAYNGAAAQVTAAFSERERTEQHLRLILGEAGHEMRTPLTVISAYLEMLEQEGPGAVLAPETLQTLRVETRRLRALVERVMSLARMEGSDRSRAELIDVTEVAEDAIAHVTTVQGGDVRLTSSAPTLSRWPSRGRSKKRSGIWSTTRCATAAVRRSTSRSHSRTAMSSCASATTVRA